MMYRSFFSVVIIAGGACLAFGACSSSDKDTLMPDAATDVGNAGGAGGTDGAGGSAVGGSAGSGGGGGPEVPYGCGPACDAMVASSCSAKPASVDACLTTCQDTYAILDANTGCGDAITAENKCMEGKTLSCVENKPQLASTDCVDETKARRDCVQAKAAAIECNALCNRYFRQGCIDERKVKQCENECIDFSVKSLYVAECPDKFKAYLNCMLRATYGCSDVANSGPLGVVRECTDQTSAASACLGLGRD